MSFEFQWVFLSYWTKKIFLFMENKKKRAKEEIRRREREEVVEGRPLFYTHTVAIMNPWRN